MRKPAGLWVTDEYFVLMCDRFEIQKTMRAKYFLEKAYTLVTLISLVAAQAKIVRRSSVKVEQ
jgi:hypothetical protein